MCTAWAVLTGTQLVRNVGDLARFGAILFQVLAPLQLALVVFFSALQAASTVAQEKDRKTLVLLLLTNLTNSELVLGKLLASLLNVLVLVVASLPLFLLITLFGGVSFEQIGRVFAVTLASALAGGSLGSTIALWREKTYQSLALTALALVLWLGAWEIVRTGVLGAQWAGVPCHTWAAAASPWRAVWEATRPYAAADPALGRLESPVNLFLLVALAAAAILNGVAVALVRVWNPPREYGRAQEEHSGDSIWGAEHDLRTELAPTGQVLAPGHGVADLASAAMRRRNQARAAADDPAAARRRPRTRAVWDNPILWREVRTWAYGRRTAAIRVAYFVVAVLAAAAVHQLATGARASAPGGAGVGGGGGALILLSVVSLVLVNAQAVTALTSERDAKALDLLLVTDLTPNEIIYGKLGGILYNTKEMVLAPILLAGYLALLGGLSGENLVYLVLGLLVMNAFVAMLGVHAGMTYANSRQAIGVSLGTVFFLFVGVYVCMRIMIAFGGSFQLQFLPFSAVVLGGGAGMFFALGARNPSPAIALASITCPIATFYAITSFFLDMPLAVFLVTAMTYGFTTAAMLIPAVYEFDVATGRTTGGEE
jgi:ABC-type transport system involved in multi-copper enzyme maturation permease subunit